jgi:hypothetical protein
MSWNKVILWVESGFLSSCLSPGTHFFHLVQNVTSQKMEFVYTQERAWDAECCGTRGIHGWWVPVPLLA